ncbi:FeoC like transcriptional regulator [Beggiatoa alba B18LD]|uniref:FeoC like transcriptional regulator n=1 Tax=Beggiatoa alba B18LD TaxID=395493 RepID=I3CBJ1_9GAMM|nr:FeoC-like transcriptional regulator [Beggiatoa alba]EIJ40984.1 FeoC like transcriptional regulator [Beggiatoa alba B18LD]
MTLTTLKSYLIQHHQATLIDLAHHFNRDPETVKAALEHWVQKGKVKHNTLEACQKSCCKNAGLDVYEWLDA